MKQMALVGCILLIGVSVPMSASKSLVSIATNMIPDSVRYDTLVIHNPSIYYQFVQYFDSSRVLMYFGEVRVCSATHGCSRIMLGAFDPIVHRPLLDSGLLDLTSKTYTGDMIVYPGDTIYYYTMLQEVNDYNDTTAAITVRDTVGYFIDLVERLSHDSLVIDSVGVRPHASITELGQALITNGDTTLLSSYVIGPQYNPGVVYLRVRPFFRGVPDRCSISRWDLIEKHPYSQWGQLMRSIAFAVIDSLALQKSMLSPFSARGYSITTQYVANTMSLRYTAANTGDHVLKIYNSGGRELYSRKHTMAHSGEIRVDVRDWASGSYYILLSGNGVPVLVLTTVIAR